MKKVIFIIAMLISGLSYSQEGYNFLVIDFGQNILISNNNYVFQFQFEKVNQNYSSTLYGINAYKSGDKEEYLGVYGFNRAISKSKNFVSKLNLNLNLGHNRSKVLLGLGMGLNVQYHLRNDIVLFIEHQYKFLFTAEDIWRNQTSIGFKIPI